MGFDSRLDGGTLLHAMQDMIAEALSGFTGPRAVAGCLHDAHVFRAEIEKKLQNVQLQLTQLVTTAMASMQAEADRRADSMLQSLEQMLAELNEAQRRELARLKEQLAQMQEQVAILVRRQAGHNLDNVYLQGPEKLAAVGNATVEMLHTQSQRSPPARVPRARRRSVR